ncbi:MAG: flagellar motor switch protein FliN [Acidimicrobiales bacterium]
MTPSTATEALGQVALSQLVLAAADDFPIEGLLTGPADPQEDLSELLPSDDAFVLVIPTLSDPVTSVLCIVAPDQLSEMGLADADGLVDALVPVISELSAGHELDVASSRLGVGTIGLAGVPVTGSGPGALLMAAGLFAGAAHVATVGVAVHPEGGVVESAPDDPATPVADHGVGGGAPMDLPQVDVAAAAAQAAPVAAAARSLHLLRDVEMSVTAELGRTKMTVSDLLSLTPGSVVELDRAAGTPIDLLVNGTLIARGEVVVIDEEFGVRISEIIDRNEHA